MSYVHEQANLHEPWEGERAHAAQLVKIADRTDIWEGGIIIIISIHVILCGCLGGGGGGRGGEGCTRGRGGGAKGGGGGE